MAKNFVLESAVAFSFPVNSAFNVPAITAKKDWITLDSGPEFVVMNNGTQLCTIQRDGNNCIRENIYRVGSTPLSVREKDTLFYQNLVDHKPPSRSYERLNKLLKTAEEESIEVC